MILSPRRAKTISMDFSPPVDKVPMTLSPKPLQRKEYMQIKTIPTGAYKDVPKISYKPPSRVPPIAIPVSEHEQTQIREALGSTKQQEVKKYIQMREKGVPMENILKTIKLRPESKKLYKDKIKYALRGVRGKGGVTEDDLVEFFRRIDREEDFDVVLLDAEKFGKRIRQD